MPEARAALPAGPVATASVLGDGVQPPGRGDLFTARRPLQRDRHRLLRLGKHHVAQQRRVDIVEQVGEVVVHAALCHTRTHGRGVNIKM